VIKVSDQVGEILEQIQKCFSFWRSIKNEEKD